MAEDDAYDEMMAERDAALAEVARRVRYTADVVLFASFSAPWEISPDPTVDPSARVLLIRRRWEPYQDMWALPGGHVDPGETSRAAAVRELNEETGVLLPESRLDLVGVFDAPARDPRGRYVSAAYCATQHRRFPPRAGSDAAEVRWWQLSSLPTLDLAFDHKQIIEEALVVLADSGSGRLR